jgi:glycerate dehydrogenase
MSVLVAERRGAQARPGRTPFDEVLSLADIISLHCPLTAETHNLIGRAELLRMKRNAILVNIARGGIVNERDLSNALQAGEIGGAAFDVLTVEPPRAGAPLLSLTHPKLIVTPHIAWASHNSRQRLVNEVAENIRAFLSGCPRNVVCN